MKLLFWKKAPVPQAQKPLPSLAACIVMDLIGYASFGIPVLGEFLDLVWAPLSAFIFWRMFGGARGMLGGAFNFIEELMPGLDFIPTFTITWFIQYAKRKKTTSYTLQPVNR